MSNDQRFSRDEWQKIKTALRLGVYQIELGQNTSSARKAQRAYEDAQQEFSWLLSQITKLLSRRENNEGTR